MAIGTAVMSGWAATMSTSGVVATFILAGDDELPAAPVGKPSAGHRLGVADDARGAVRGELLVRDVECADARPGAPLQQVDIQWPACQHIGVKQHQECAFRKVTSGLLQQVKLEVGTVKPCAFWKRDRRPDRQEPWTHSISDVSEITPDVLRHV